MHTVLLLPEEEIVAALHKIHMSEISLMASSLDPAKPILTPKMILKVNNINYAKIHSKNQIKKRFTGKPPALLGKKWRSNK
jgi:hypothetical protein